ncbi:sensor histidine kinase [Microbacterium sp.]|uniref:sensor histidine kinase n=1 Tax=Microbacterium sp. TaxID=51671 RepID=UPI0028123A5B|nr:sensor histidine kinase [Microbacterium sp.]
MALLTREPSGTGGLTTAPQVAPRTRPTRRDLRADVVLAGALFVAAVLSVTLSALSQLFSFRDDAGAWPLLFAALTTLPLAVRRRFPVAVAVTIAAAYFAGTSLELAELYVSQVTMFVAFYTVGAWMDDRRRAAWARWLIILAMFVWMLVSTYLGAMNPNENMPDTAGAFSPYVAYMLILWLINVAYFGGAYYLGDRAYAAARDRDALRRRTRELEEEREMSAAQAVMLDRVRIARELHDVVAHHVSAMGVQAGAARTVLDTDPDAARGILTAVEQSARGAIDELHLLLDTLRAPEAGDEQASTLRLTGLAQLAHEMTAAGTPTTFTVVGEPIDVPETVHVNLYRVAQEALTNARRHAGPDVTADMRLRYDSDAVELEVTNTGRTSPVARPGLGQLGMRERAIASGGSVEFGPRERGGYLVRVRVPVNARGAV